MIKAKAKRWVKDEGSGWRAALAGEVLKGRTYNVTREVEK